MFHARLYESQVFLYYAQDGKIPIMYAAVNGQRELAEILFPKTRPIPSVPDWNVQGIRSMKYLFFKAQVCKTISNFFWALFSKILMGTAMLAKLAVAQFY